MTALPVALSALVRAAVVAPPPSSAAGATCSRASAGRAAVPRFAAAWPVAAFLLEEGDEPPGQGSVRAAAVAPLRHAAAVSSPAVVPCKALPRRRNGDDRAVHLALAAGSPMPRLFARRGEQARPQTRRRHGAERRGSATRRGATSGLTERPGSELRPTTGKERRAMAVARHGPLAYARPL